MYVYTLLAYMFIHGSGSQAITFIPDVERPLDKSKCFFAEMHRVARNSWRAPDGVRVREPYCRASILAHNIVPYS